MLRNAIWVLGVLLLLASRGVVAATERGLPSHGTPAERRVALVIGNGAYREGALRNPVNDARAVAARLERMGFEVTRLLNADKRTMEQADRDFARKLSGEHTVGLFYFAGHGVELEGQNYLVPIGANIQGDTDVRYEAVNAGRVLDGMRRAGNGLNLVILDACRNNPFTRGFRGAGQGLGAMRPATGTLILYAAEPGQKARDGEGSNGVFTEHLLAALEQPGLTVEQVLKRTAREVSAATDGEQTPWQEGMILGNFYFVPPPPPVRMAPPPPPPRRPLPPPPMGYLQVVVNVDDARVTVNGRGVGTASAGRPLNLSQGLPVGLVQVLVSAPGRESQVRTEAIRAGLWTQAVFSLRGTPAPPPQPPPPPTPADLEQALALGWKARRDVQEALNELGHNAGPLDGAWGEQTRTAIGAWQRGAGREATGYLTAAGYQALLAQGREALAARQEREAREQARRRNPSHPIPPDSGTTPGRFVKLDATGRALPEAARAWNCVRDTITGLVWEVKTDDGGLRDKDHTYTWYDPDPKTNGGNAGTQGGGKCGGGARCDTTGYAQAVNRGEGLCGARDWRVPNREELRSIADLGRYKPAIDTAWFPNTPSSGFWSASPYASFSDVAWYVFFNSGFDYRDLRSYAVPVRLVRAGQ